MDLKQKQTCEALAQPSSLMLGGPSRSLDPNRPFSAFDSTNPCYNSRVQQPLLEFTSSLGNRLEAPLPTMNNAAPAPDWDPKAMLSNLSFLEQKVHQVQDMVRLIINQESRFANRANELAAQQQLVTADLTCIIIQLISAAGTLLPSIKSNVIATNPTAGQLGSLIDSQTSLGLDGNSQQKGFVPLEEAKFSEYEELIKGLNNSGSEGDDLIKCLSSCEAERTETAPIEDHDMKESEDGADGENLPPGSYEVLQLEKEEILAPHTHFCMICGKGFKRDANLRMHMRGHGDEYKTAAALAKPTKEPSSEPVVIKRYSCPFVGCKRNKDHKKFQPLKTILCVKNHYKRSHCDKSYTCSRCNTKKFSVIADLKTHEKHCGRDKWLCSCGTTFSRKDKLFGHVALFQGHTPALPMDDVKVSGASDQGQSSGLMAGMGSMGYSFSGSTSEDGNVLDIKGVDDDRGFFSPMNFDSCNFGGLDDFPRPAFEVSESSFAFLSTGTCNAVRKNGESTSSNHLG